MTKASLQKLTLNIGMAGIAAMLFTLLFGTYSSWYSLAYIALMTAIFTVAISFIRSRIDAGYEKRISAETPVDWEVQVNDVAVGRLTDVELASIQRRVFHDVTVALTQGKNALGVALNVLTLYLKTIPLLMFWFVAAAIALDPTAVQQDLATYAGANSQQLLAEFIQLLKTLTTATILVCPVMALLGLRFGYEDKYRQVVGEQIRAHCKTPAEGKIQLFSLNQLESGAHAHR